MSLPDHTLNHWYLFIRYHALSSLVLVDMFPVRPCSFDVKESDRSNPSRLSGCRPSGAMLRPREMPMYSIFSYLSEHYFQIDAIASRIRKTWSVRWAVRPPPAPRRGDIYPCFERVATYCALYKRVTVFLSYTTRIRRSYASNFSTLNRHNSTELTYYLII